MGVLGPGGVSGGTAAELLKATREARPRRLPVPNTADTAGLARHARLRSGSMKWAMSEYRMEGPGAGK